MFVHRRPCLRRKLVAAVIPQEQSTNPLVAQLLLQWLYLLQTICQCTTVDSGIMRIKSELAQAIHAANILAFLMATFLVNPMAIADSQDARLPSQAA